jgi:hypothetical protein
MSFNQSRNCRLSWTPPMDHIDCCSSIYHSCTPCPSFLDVLHYYCSNAHPLLGSITACSVLDALCSLLTHHTHRQSTLYKAVCTMDGRNPPWTHQLRPDPTLCSQQASLQTGLLAASSQRWAHSGLWDIILQRRHAAIPSASVQNHGR